LKLLIHNKKTYTIESKVSVFKKEEEAEAEGQGKGRSILDTIP
jgi:hypothetical protein